MNERTNGRREKRRKRERGVAGNKRLANPPCQFNLASNPAEMLIRSSQALSLSLSTSRSLLSWRPLAAKGPLSVCTRARATRARGTLYSRKDTAESFFSSTWKLCAKRVTRADRLRFSLLALSSPSLSSGYAFLLLLRFAAPSALPPPVPCDFHPPS